MGKRTGLIGTVFGIIIALVMVVLSPTARAERTTKIERQNFSSGGTTFEDPAGRVYHKLCIMPESKLKFIEAGRVLRTSMTRAFQQGDMNPSRFIEQVARQTGYGKEDIESGQGFACYTYFTFLPALADFMFQEGTADFACDGNGPSAARERASVAASIAANLIANNGVFDAKFAFDKARESGMAFEDGDFAAFRNFAFAPALFRFMEKKAIESLKED